MTSPRKNIMVGITVLGAFVTLGWMIVKFGGTLGGLLGPSGYPIAMTVERVEGLAAGNKVRYLGSAVGRVDSIVMSDDRLGFDVTLIIEDDTNLPQNVEGVVRAINLISGGAAVDLELLGATADGSLRDSERIAGKFAGASLLPPEIAGLGEQAGTLLEDIQRSGLVENLNAQISAIGELTDNVNALVAEDGLQNDVRQTIANARQASESAAKFAADLATLGTQIQELQADASVVMGNAKDITGEIKTTVEQTGQLVADAGETVDELGTRMIASAETLNKTLADINKITASLEAGEGTAGKLLKDDRAYQLLVDNMRILNTTLSTTERLLQQWEEEGVNIDF